MKRKMMRIILTGVCAVCLTACGKSEKDAASDYYQEQFGMSEEDADELANALYGNGGVQTGNNENIGTETTADERAGLYQSDGSFIHWNDLNINVTTDYAEENYQTEENRPYKVFTDNDYNGELVLPNDLTQIGMYAFCGCESLTSIEFPDTLTSIEAGAFENCTSLTSIDLSNTQITSLNRTFYGCESLTSIEFPDTLTSITSQAFGNCTSLTSIDLSNTQITSIEATWEASNMYSIHGDLKSPFDGCTSLTSIDLSNTQLTNIGANAFRGCESLISIEFPDTLTSIEEQAFYGCTSLTSIDLSNTTATNIGRDVFYGCESLTSIEFPDTLTSMESASEMAYDTGTFKNCTSLTNIDLSNTQITELPIHIFENCTSLTNIVLPDTLTHIDSFVFEYCTSLANINYTGTMEEWNALDKALGWDVSASLETITCSDGVINLK